VGVTLGYSLGLPGAWGILVAVFSASAAALLISLPARVAWAWAETHGPLAEAREARRVFLSRCRVIQTELISCLHTLNAAIVSGKWWRPNEALTAEHWHAHHDALADRSTAYTDCQRAYIACDRANKRSLYHTMLNEPVEEGERPLLRHAETKVEEAIGAINEVIAETP
jgi:hypothetical protein